jgi:hypothetical protein
LQYLTLLASLESIFPITFQRKHIIGIIYGTVHQIHKPATDQHLWWNDHYQFHAVHLLFFVDYEGWIIGVETGIPGSFHDSSAANNAKFFEKLVKDKFVLGDPGFQGVGYVIAGFKSNQLPTPAHKAFDSLSRTEQVKIEHINNFVKKCKTLSKTDVFIHQQALLSGCVIV